MPPELLQDLAEYKKFRDREVASAARGLIGLFRDINPGVCVGGACV
jgi:protein SDA1